jgi:hypothetical protein
VALNSNVPYFPSPTITNEYKIFRRGPLDPPLQRVGTQAAILKQSDYISVPFRVSLHQRHVNYKLVELKFSDNDI